MKNLLLCIGLISILSSYGQNLNAPKYSNQFLNIGIGARALAMSNSVISSTEDVTAGYWNPAGLTQIDQDLQIGLMHAEYFAGIAKYDYGSISKNIDKNSAASFSFIRFGVDNIPNTTELIDAQGNVNYDRISYFTAADMAFLMSYGRKLNENLSIGGTAKIINRKAGDFANAWGFGFDFGAKYQLDSWKFAIMGKDITSTFNVWNYHLDDEMINTFVLTGNELPQNGVELTLPRIILGASKLVEFPKNISLLTELNIDLTTDGNRNVLISADPISADPHIGLELNIKDLIFLRSGIGNIQTYTDNTNKSVYTIQPNIGLGLKIKGVTIEYALTDIGDASVALYSNIFSLKFDLNPN